MGCSCSKRADDAPDEKPQVRQPPAPPQQPATPPRQEAQLPKTPPSPPSGSSTASVPSPVVPPSPPKAWRASIEEDVSDGESPTKDVEIELEDRSRREDDDDDDDFGGDNAVAFADAWTSFKSQKDPGFGKLRDYARAHYAQLLRMLLAPKRERCTRKLGPVQFEFRGRSIVRDDFAVVCDRGHDLQCSLWRDDLGLGSKLYRWRSKKTCVLYVHDVGGSRLGALSCLGVALDAGAAGYCALDTTACGESGGRRVSFGSLERWDIGCVAQELVKRRGFTDVVLWGRGAGAVACVLYASVATPPSKDTSYFGDAVAYMGLEDAVGEKDPYPSSTEITIDIEDVDEFMRGTEVEQTTYVWVASKPTLQISKCMPASGLRVGDVICGVGTSTHLPHSSQELRDLLEKVSSKKLHVFRKTDATRQSFFGDDLPIPSGLILDCVVDSPVDVVEALKGHAAEREPILTGLLEPLLATALEVLCHSVEKRTRVDPRSVRCAKAASSLTMPALYAINDYADVDRGVPRLASTSRLVFDAHGGSTKSLCRYNAPLRLALRGSLDAMSSGFLDRAHAFLRQLTDGVYSNGPRWCVTTRPWDQAEAEQTIDDYEGAADDSIDGGE